MNCSVEKINCGCQKKKKPTNVSLADQGCLYSECVDFLFLCQRQRMAGGIMSHGCPSVCPILENIISQQHWILYKPSVSLKDGFFFHIWCKHWTQGGADHNLMVEGQGHRDIISLLMWYIRNIQQEFHYICQIHSLGLKDEMIRILCLKVKWLKPLCAVWRWCLKKSRILSNLAQMLTETCASID